MSENISNPAVLEMRGVEVVASRDTALTVVKDVNW